MLFQNKDRLQRRLETLSTQARAQAMIAFHTDVEWRRARALASALKVDAVQEHSKFLVMTMECEAATYANAVSEPPETSIEALASCTVAEIDKRKKCSIATFDHDAAAFAISNAEFEDFETLTCEYLYLLVSDNIE
jgi:hypothetical protein